MKLSSAELEYLTLISKATDVVALDVVAEKECVGVWVKPGDLWKILGRNGLKIQQLKKAIGASIIVIESPDDPLAFLENSFKPITPKAVSFSEENGAKHALVTIDSKDRFKVGRNKVEIVKKFIERNFEIKNMKLKYS